MADGWRWLAEEMERLQSAGLLRNRRRVVSRPDGWCEVGTKRIRNFASNDYLNLAHDPRLVAAAQEAMAESGIGAAASALVTGRSAYHELLEEKLARFEGQESAVLFPTGYAANVGTISALVQPGDVIFCDRLNHASLIDGCRLSGAKLLVYRHRQLDKLTAPLQRATGYRRRWIITDSVFSMDGDLAPLKELCDIAERHDARLVVDEAHATGLFGEHGRGVTEAQGVEDRIAVRIGTLSKAVGTLGGFVAGPKVLADWLWNNARTQMFSTALPPAVCAAAICALEVIETEPWRRERVLALAKGFRDDLKQLGLETPPGGVGPIVPIVLGDAQFTVKVARELDDAGFLVAAIRPPTVPAGTSRLRITVTAAHSEEDLKGLIAHLGKSMKSLRPENATCMKDAPHE
jgi:8-amino-7-oxononanoate synthase